MCLFHQIIWISWVCRRIYQTPGHPGIKNSGGMARFDHCTYEIYCKGSWDIIRIGLDRAWGRIILLIDTQSLGTYPGYFAPFATMLRLQTMPTKVCVTRVAVKVCMANRPHGMNTHQAEWKDCDNQEWWGCGSEVRLEIFCTSGSKSRKHLRFLGFSGTFPYLGFSLEPPTFPRSSLKHHLGKRRPWRPGICEWRILFELLIWMRRPGPPIYQVWPTVCKSWEYASAIIYWCQEFL